MTKLFYYELKGQLWTKTYGIFFLLVLLYSYFVLTSHTILGIDGTAPFSLISFQNYLLQIAPIILLYMVMQMILILSKDSELDAIFTASGTKQKQRTLLQYTAILVCVLLMELLSVGLCFGFYAWFFSYVEFWAFSPSIGLIVLGTLATGCILGCVSGMIKRCFFTR